MLYLKQLKNTHRKLESDLANSTKRLKELVEQRDSLKRGREESVSLISRIVDPFYP